MSAGLVFAILFLLPGLALVFVPLFPALAYMFLVSLLYGVLNRFDVLSGQELTILGAVTLTGIIIDQLAGILGAKWGGATRKGMLWGFCAAVVGSLVGSPLLGFVGLFVAILAAEISQFRGRREAMRAATGAVIGMLAGWLTNIALAFTFFGLFLYFTLR